MTSVIHVVRFLWSGGYDYDRPQCRLICSHHPLKPECYVLFCIIYLISAMNTCIFLSLFFVRGKQLTLPVLFHICIKFLLMNMNVFVEYFHDYRSFNLYLWGIVPSLTTICIVFFMSWSNLMKISKKKKNHWNNIEMWSRSLCKIFIISWSTKSWVNVCMGEMCTRSKLC